MGMSKVTCPNCGKLLTVDPKSIYSKCPLCGAPIFDVPVDLPPLVVRYDIRSLDEFLKDGFEFLYFRAYDKLFELSTLMLKLHPDNFYSYLFNLIGKTEIDFIFLIKDINVKLTDEEIEEDMRSRYYFYARKKYSKSPQNIFSKISGHYPDLPGDKRGKWEKARTKYDEYHETIKKYFKVSDMIHSEYMTHFNRTAKNEDELNILKNIQIWLDQVSHAHLDLQRYNQEADEVVKQDYIATPYPGNKPKFTAYLTIYILALITLILGVTDIVISIVNGSTLAGVYGYLSVSIYNALLISAAVVWIVNGSLFQDRPLLGVGAIVGSVILTASGFITANVKVRISWFSIFATVMAIALIAISIIKGMQYLPRSSRKCTTIIGDLPKLIDNSFEVNFSFEWKKYEGRHIQKIKFKEDWLRGE